jgi:anti-anti-sigma factor
MEFIDSSGIGILVSIAKFMRQKGGDIVLSGSSAEVLAIFKVVNLQEFIKIFTTEGEAINHFHAL